MNRKFFGDLGLGSVLAATLAAATASHSTQAHACGGFFCSAASPVNQAAEQIIFSENGDGTVTAVIQILYQGPANKFAWVLPVAGSPKVGVSSNIALAALKSATNPNYQLNTVFDDCGTKDGAPGANGGFTNAPPVAMGPTDPSVNQVASGAVGPYLYDVISVDPTLDAPEAAAAAWLDENGYDIGALGADVLRPYLAEGLNLIAFKLQKGNDAGSIRPVMLTYESNKPAIPIRPTAVAAMEDMGVMVWVLSASRAIPGNYKALELNEALINWFNPMSNYNEVVSRAADEAMGQGFVTEYAGKMQDLKTQQGFDVFPDFQGQAWQNFMANEHLDPISMIEEAVNNWGGWDGYDDALRAAVTLPDTVTFDDFRTCTRCYVFLEGVSFDTQTFLLKLYELVIKPVIETETLLDSRPYLTRLYTTMSADEMTTDPVFDFNPDLGDASNFHVAERHMQCDGGWRVEFEDAGTVSGSGFGAWPVAIESQPAAMRILEYGTSGKGRVIEDRTREIVALNKPVAPPEQPAMAGRSPSGNGGTGSGVPVSTAGTTGSAGGRDAGTGEDAGDEPASKSGDGCSAGGGSAGNTLSLLLFACAALFRRARKGGVC